MAQQVKALAAKLDNPCSSSQDQTVEGEKQFSQAFYEHERYM